MGLFSVLPVLMAAGRGAHMEHVEHQFWEALRVLMCAFFAYQAYNQTYKYSNKNGRLLGLRNGLLICAGIAALATFSMGRPSCDDPVTDGGGGCEQYADDGFTPTDSQYAGTFVYWIVLLGSPMLIGVMNSRHMMKPKWRKPQD